MKVFIFLAMLVALACANSMKPLPGFEGLSPEEAAIKDFFDKANPKQKAQYGFDGQCISLSHECQRAARNPIQRIQCLAQAAACMGAKAIGCSGHCIAPMIQCKLANIGNWAGIFKCCADFIGCAIGGCVGGGGGGGPGTGGGEGPPPGLGYSAVEEKKSPEEAVMELMSAEKAAYGLDGQCISLGIECQRAARNPIQRIQCLAQGAACMGAKALGCSGHCIAPMIQCKLANIGNWAGIFKCCADFIGCAVGGCVGGGGGGGPGTGGGEGPPPGLGYSAVEDKVSPEEAAMQLMAAEKAAYGLDGQCISLGIECQRAARNPIQRIQCLAQGAACMGAKALGCSGHCIAPMIQCKLANIGNWAGIFKCCADFIGCAVGGCVGGGGGGGPGTGGGEGPPPGLGYSAVEEKVSPEEAAMQLMAAESAAYGFDGQCISLGIECQRAARNPIQRIQCLAQGAACMGAKALGCSGHCIAPMIQCKLANIGNWAGIFKCCADFIGCAVGGCVGGGGGGGPGTGGGEGPPPGLGYSAVEEKVSPEEAAMQLMAAESAAYGFDGQCISLGIECQRAARNPIQRIQCLAQGAACMGAKALGCSGHKKEKIAPMIQCKLANIGNWAGIFKCCADFIGCAVGGCVGGGGGGGPGTGGGEGPPPGLGYSAVEDKVSPEEAAMQLMHAESAAYGFDGQCISLGIECQRAAQNPIQRIQCLAQGAACMGAKAIGCSGHCIAPMIQCKLANIGNWAGIFKCCADFIGCAVGGCVGGGGGGGPPGGMGYSAVEKEMSPINAAVEMYYSDKDNKAAYNLFDDTCRMMHGECDRAAHNFIQKMQCLAQLGMCIGAKAVGCSGHCIPPMIQCKLGAIGNWPAMFKCCADFIGCAAGGCLTGGSGGGGGGGPEIPGGGGPPGGMMFKMDKEDYTPYEFAIATAFNDTDFAYGIDFQHCLAEHQQCAGNPDIKQKIGCFIRFGMCIGLQAAGCTAMCVPQLGLCTALNIGNWPGTFICATKFVFCAKSHCLS